MFKIVNSYEDVDMNMFFKPKEGNITRGHRAALVKEQCRLDMRKYSCHLELVVLDGNLVKSCYANMSALHCRYCYGVLITILMVII